MFDDIANKLNVKSRTAEWKYNKICENLAAGAYK